MVRQEDELIVSQDGLTLFDRFGKMIYAYIRQRTSSREEAKDLAIDVFVAAFDYSKLSSFSEKDQGLWLRRVAHNKLIDSYRRTSRHPVITLDEVAETLFEDASYSPEQMALQQDMYQHLRQMIKQLPVLQQQILQWRYSDELCFADIALLLDKREETVRQICSRAVARLRSLFHEQGRIGNDR